MNNELFIYLFNLTRCFRFIYQAVVRPGAGTREDRDKKPIIVIDSVAPPILVHPNQIGGAMSAGEVFNIGVRLKTSQVSKVCYFDDDVDDKVFITQETQSERILN